MKLACPYCGVDALLVDGAAIYPHRFDLYQKRFYLCRPCDAYVGTHRDGKPLGTPANKVLRSARKQAHAAFDPMWQGKARDERSRAYAWLSGVMQLPKEQTHIGMFNVEQCQRVVNACADAIRARSQA